MKEEAKVLKIFHLSHPLMTTEWTAVLGDKYNNSLPFSWSFASNIQEAQVVVWDGVMTPKMGPLLGPLLEDFKQTKVLLLVGESMTLLKNHSIVKLVSLDDLRYVEISGWSVLPEEILGAIEACYQKLNHV